MPDEKTQQKMSEWVGQVLLIYLEKAADEHLSPYVKQMSEGMQRGMKLVAEASKVDQDAAAEILRAVVVLNHAYLEDFLRTLASWLLPIANEETLNSVPLVGTFGRAERFFLGKLAAHRDKKVEDVIRESVAAHMENSTFNSVTQIITFLDSINVRVPRESNEKLPLSALPVDDAILAALDTMMKRRHHIVHRADRAKTGGGLQEIRQEDVVWWLGATQYFTIAIASDNFMRRHSLEEFRRELSKEMKKAWKLDPPPGAQ